MRQELKGLIAFGAMCGTILMAGISIGLVLKSCESHADDEPTADNWTWTIEEMKPEDYSLDRNPIYSVIGPAGTVEVWLVGGQLEVRCDGFARQFSPRACAGARDLEQKR